jgi:hypothetical protein
MGANTNILQFFKNVANYVQTDLSKIAVISKSRSSSINRINMMGEALEFFVKDGFCNSFKVNDPNIKRQVHSEYFSYLGNQNNPPDIIIRKGDAIEVKKIDGLKSVDIALNSSYPKCKLYSDSQLITSACKDCEDWREKDIIYAIGLIDHKKIKVLMMIYGDCYAANKEIYERVKENISSSFENLNLEFSKTKELGRINKVDPLGITNLRIRGMWTIKNPIQVYPEIFNYSKEDSLTVISLMRKSKFESFNKNNKDELKKLKGCEIKEIKIPEPNNLAKLTKAIIIKLQIK